MKFLKGLCKRSVWCVLTGFFAIMLAVVIVGGNIAGTYSSSINGLLGINPYEVVGSEENATYFESDYLKTDAEGNAVYDDRAMREASMQIAENVASDGSVLLWNNEVGGQNTLPLAEGSRISLFGIGSVNYKISGGGSGEISSSPGNNLKAELERTTAEGGPGFKVNGTLFNAYSGLRSSYGTSNVQGKLTKDTAYNGSNGYLDERYREFYVNEVPWTVLNEKIPGGVESTLQDGKNTKGYGDAAVMILTRDGAEDGDTWFHTAECYDNNYLDLSYEEAGVLSALQRLKEAGTVKKIVLILNTASVMQMKHIAEYGVDACILVGAGGIASFKAIANLLSGKTNPSGRLVDTIAYDIDSAPATENFGDFRWTQSGANLPTNINVYNNSYVVYREGIYVGYRYYETRYEDAVMNKGNASSSAGVKAGSGSWRYADEVAFPFGYGCSYTTFEYSGLKVTHEEGGYGGTYHVTVTVKNTGGLAGKTAVQVYLQKPYTDYDVRNRVEKASVELVGFTKTETIPAGESRVYTIQVKGSEFKSYDTYGAGTYILEKGDYYLATGADAHDALNHILAQKGYTSADGMVDSLGNPFNGKAELAARISVTNDDFESYSSSEWTGADIGNRLSDGDLNLYAGTKDDQSVAYLSRNNWQATYPSAVSLKCGNAVMVSDMQYSHGAIADDGSEMPVQSAVTADEEYLKLLEQERLKLINFKNMEFDDPLWQNLLDQLSLSDMNTMLSGGYLNLIGATSVDAPGGVAADGTSGVRNANPTTGDLMGFPTQTVMAQTWDVELIEKLGVAFGHECLHANTVELYAPGANMHRTPYGGRNWEYYSEDGFMTGKMLAAEVKGLQSKGIIVCAKHFAFNDQEINRCGGSTWMNEQTAREIYLKGFELGVNEGEVMSLMSSFPRLGCKWVGLYAGLFTDILRGEWNFNGFVETDSAFGQYYMTHYGARAEGLLAGVDFWMSGGHTDTYGLGTPADGKLFWELYHENARVVKAMREACHRVLYAQLHSAAMNGISAASEIVYVTPWWIAAIEKAKLAVGVIAGLCAAMAVASFVLYATVWKKD